MKLVLLLLSAFLMTACPEIGTIGSKQETFSGQNTIVLSGSRPDILNVIAESGKSMGLSITLFSKETSTIGFGRDPNMAIGMLIGKFSAVQMQVNAGEEGKHIVVSTTVAGNFGTGNQEAAAELFNDFKGNLLKRIGPNIVEDTSTTAKQVVSSRPCLTNYSAEGSIQSGQILKTFQLFPNAKKLDMVELMTVHLISQGYQLHSANKEIGIISASQSVSKGRVISVNVVIKDLVPASVRTDVIVQVPAGLMVTSSPQQELCKIVEVQG